MEFIPLNTNRRPFDSVKVRQALNFAIDRRKIAHLYGGPDNSITFERRRTFQLSVDGDWLLDFPSAASFLPPFFGRNYEYNPVYGFLADQAWVR